MTTQQPIDDEVLRDLRKWTKFVICFALIAELFHFLLAGGPVIQSFDPGIKWQNWTIFIGAFFGIPSLVFLLGRKWPRQHVTTAHLTLICGVLFFFYQLIFESLDEFSKSNGVLLLVLTPIGVFGLGLAIYRLVCRPKLFACNWATDLVALVALVFTLSVATNAGLNITRIIFPATWDYHLYRIDGAFVGVATHIANLNDMAPPFIKAFTQASYNILIICLYVMVGLTLRSGRSKELHIWRILILPFVFAFPLYAWLPVSGPIYTFFDGQFPANMPLFTDVAASQVIIPPAARNGMPSMHLTGAFLIWMLAIGLRHRVAVLCASNLVLATVWSTLAIGEHYFIDLVVALPYAAFIGTALIWPERLRASKVIAFPIWFSGAFFLMWMVFLKITPEALALNLWVVQVAASLSTVCAGYVFWGMAKISRNPLADQARVVKKQDCNSEHLKPPRWILLIFFTSGVAGLIYEVVFAKALAVTFGSTAVASYTVLATYMGGMALGAWIGGLAADKIRNPLHVYALCEAAIGIFAALTPLLFELIQRIYIHVSLDVAPDTSWLISARVFLGVLCLGVPTTLMGATMPIMFKYLRNLGVSSTKTIAPLYGANVAGAAFGSIVAGYFVLPAVGRNGGTYLAAVISLIVALYVIERNKSSPSIKERSVSLDSFETGATTSAESPSLVLGLTALATLFIGGAVTLGLEINFMHLLAVVAGNSVYAFSLMLATFLAGLGLGSFIGEKLISYFSRANIMAWAQCGVALAIALTAHLWSEIPSYFGSFEIYPVQLSFSARETIRAIVCALAMLPVAFFIGLSYPSAMSLAADWLAPSGGSKGFGIASALNTCGNIVGVLVVGFYLLPAFGSRDTSMLLALLALLIGIVATLVSQRQSASANKLIMKTTTRWIPALAACGLLIMFPNRWDVDELSTGSNVYFSPQRWGKIVDHAESVEGGLTSVAKNSSGTLTLLTNGKFQGNDSIGGEMVAQESFALFPLLHTLARDRALVIGYGTGMTARVLHESKFQLIDIAELSRDIVTMANRHFSSINQGVSDKQGVKVHYTDGRNYLLTQTAKFDLISIEITSIWFAGAANLYNQDFYALAKKRLTDRGVLQQWVQLHHISPTDLAYIVGSLRSEFKYVWLYVRGGQGVLVASNNASSLELPGEKSFASDGKLYEGGRDPAELKTHLMLSPAGVDRFISSVDPTMKSLVSTDRNLYLEHSTPKGNALGDVLTRNLKLLASFERPQKKGDGSHQKYETHN